MQPAQNLLQWVLYLQEYIVPPLYRTYTYEVMPTDVLRKSSCTSALQKVPAQFKAAQYTDKKLTLLNGPHCKKLELILK